MTLGEMLGVTGSGGGGGSSRDVHVVDASNLVRHEFENGVEPGLEWRHEVRFLKALAASARRAGYTYVYFDGPARHKELSLPPSMEVHFSGPEKADESIIARLRLLRITEPFSRVGAVTYDRDLTRRIKDEGAQALRPDAWLRALGI